jgi:hypothetical protein
MKMKMNPLCRLIVVLSCLQGFLFACGSPIANDADRFASEGKTALSKETGFSFDCDNTVKNPCHKLVASFQGKTVALEPSSVVWSKRYKKAILVSDNYNDLLKYNASHYVISFFEFKGDSPTIHVKPLLTPKQAAEFALYDLEGVTLQGNRLYAIGSLSLHGRNPERDRWERYQFVQLDLQQSESSDVLIASNLSHVTRRWPNFREWLISQSGYPWSGEAIHGRAEGKGINVEGLSTTSSGTLILGFRGPWSPQGGILALEIKPPLSPDQEPVLVGKHSIGPLDSTPIGRESPKTLRSMVEITGRPREFYVLVGPQGYEKESLILARWNASTGEIEKATTLPEGFVAEGVALLDSGKLLLVDDLNGEILIATEI